MKRLSFSIAAIVICSGGGCQWRQLRTANEDLERENFQLEQRLDELTFQLEDAKVALACRDREYIPGYESRPTYAPSRGSKTPSERRTPDTRSPADDVDVPPSVELPPGETMRERSRLPHEPVPRFSGPPLISPPDPKVPDGTLRDSTPAEGDAPTWTESAAAPGAAGAAARLIGQGASEEVASLVVNATLTEWRKKGSGSSGDEGLRVVVEPRDADGKLIAARGDVAIVVMDPVKEGSAARLARWDFSAEEAARHAKGTKPGGGLHFILQWPDAAPTTDDLLLFVRLTTPDGQQFVAEFALRPATDAKPAAAWVEASDRDGGPAVNHGQQSPSKGWQRAAIPLPPRQQPPAVEAARLTPAAPTTAADSGAGCRRPDLGPVPLARRPCAYVLGWHRQLVVGVAKQQRSTMGMLMSELPDSTCKLSGRWTT